MYRIGYATDGFYDWTRRNMITGFGEPGEWNGQHFRSPSVIDFGDYLLVAIEGWPDDDNAAGIGLLIGAESWLQTRQKTLVIASTATDLIQPAVVQLGNYGAGHLVINDIQVTNNIFEISGIPELPYTMESAEELVLEVMVKNGSTQSETGSLIIQSNALIGSTVSVNLIAR